MSVTMATWVAVLVVAIATGTQHATAQNSTNLYGELPKGNYNASSVGAMSTGSLSHLFNMAQGFVNVVFRPFSELESFITTVVGSTEGAFSYLGSNWQDAAKFEAGFLACLVFGILFVVFVPLVGSFMCCCRSCCGNCGGRLQQSQKRSKSCWRQCLCVTMLILTTFMAIPTVFVFLTNEWVTDVVQTAPVKTVALLNDATEYLNLVPRQLTYMTNQYSTVDENVRPLVEDFGKTVGVPLQAEVETQAEPALMALNDSIAIQKAVVASINAVDSSLSALKTGTTTVNASLQAVAATLNAMSCGSDTACLGVQASTSQLGLGFSPTDFDSLNAELQSVNNSMNEFDLDELYANITREIEEIPQDVKDQTQSASDEAIKLLDTANSTISDFSTKIPVDQFDQINQQVASLSDTITNVFNTYNDNFDKYRYIAGLVLGCILAFVVFCYYLGMVLGICGHQRKASSTERSGTSNCGGIMLMVGVGLSFIFSWLLMILVIVTFTIGGHGERYGCQSLDPPEFEALKMADNVSNLNLAATLGLPAGMTLGLTDIMKSCENDASAYQAFKLEYVFNVTQFIANVTEETNKVDDQVTTAVDAIDFTSISIYSDENQQQLLDLKNTGLEGIDFNEYLTKLGDGITKTDLTVYAAGLRTSADAFGPTLSAQKTEVQEQADEVDRIQAEEVDPLQDDYDQLNTSINALIAESQNINSSVDTLDDAMSALNESVTMNGKDLVSGIATDVTNQVTGNITSYTTWIGEEITQTLGACKPVYDTYIGFVGLFCDYLIDTINGLWFSLGWCVFFLIPSAIIAMKLMKFFRRMDVEESFEDTWDDMEMRDYAQPGAGGKSTAQYY